MFGFEYLLILSMFYVWFQVSFDTQYVLCIVSRYRLILDKFYVTFQGCRLGVFIVIVYKSPVSLTSVFKHCISKSPHLTPIPHEAPGVWGAKRSNSSLRR